MGPYVIIGAGIFLIIIVLIMSIKIVKQSTVVVVERLGKWHKNLEAGVNMIVPFLDSSRPIVTAETIKDMAGRNFMRAVTRSYIDLRERVYDFPGQNVITKDNVTIGINAMLYFQVMDPYKSVYEVENLVMAIESLTKTTLRNVIGELELDQTLASRDTINDRLRSILDEATDKWGVKVNRVELQDIVPPKDIQNAMEKQMRAERERRESILIAEGQKKSAILKAEGFRESQIAEAEGQKKSAILRAEGEAESKIKVAQAEAKSIQLLNTQLAEAKIDPAQYQIALKYISTLKEIAGQNGEKVIFMPYESSALLSSVSTIKELFSSSK